MPQMRSAAVVIIAAVVFAVSNGQLQNLYWNDISSFLLYFNGSITFPMAIQYCAAANGTVTSISNDAENNLLSALLNDSGTDNSWIGMLTFNNVESGSIVNGNGSGLTWIYNASGFADGYTTTVGGQTTNQYMRYYYGNALCLILNINTMSVQPPSLWPNQSQPSCTYSFPYVCKYNLIPNVTGSKCGQDWLTNNGADGVTKCYKFFNSSTTWWQAVANCYALNITDDSPNSGKSGAGYLLYFDSTDSSEISFLNNTITSNVWLGAMNNNPTVSERLAKVDYWLDMTNGTYRGISNSSWASRSAFCPLLQNNKSWITVPRQDQSVNYSFASQECMQTYSTAAICRLSAPRVFPVPFVPRVGQAASENYNFTIRQSVSTAAEVNFFTQDWTVGDFQIQNVPVSLTLRNFQKLILDDSSNVRHVVMLNCSGNISHSVKNSNYSRLHVLTTADWLVSLTNVSTSEVKITGLGPLATAVAFNATASNFSSNMATASANANGTTIFPTTTTSISTTRWNNAINGTTTFPNSTNAMSISDICLANTLSVVNPVATIISKNVKNETVVVLNAPYSSVRSYNPGSTYIAHDNCLNTAVTCDSADYATLDTRNVQSSMKTVSATQSGCAKLFNVSSNSFVFSNGATVSSFVNLNMQNSCFTGSGFQIYADQIAYNTFVAQNVASYANSRVSDLIINNLFATTVSTVNSSVKNVRDDFESVANVTNANLVIADSGQVSLRFSNVGNASTNLWNVTNAMHLLIGNYKTWIQETNVFWSSVQCSNYTDCSYNFLPSLVFYGTNVGSSEVDCDSFSLSSFTYNSTGGSRANIAVKTTGPVNLAMSNVDSLNTTFILDTIYSYTKFTATFTAVNDSRLQLTSKDKWNVTVSASIIYNNYLTLGGDYDSHSYDVKLYLNSVTNNFVESYGNYFLGQLTNVSNSSLINIHADEFATLWCNDSRYANVIMQTKLSKLTFANVYQVLTTLLSYCPTDANFCWYENHNMDVTNAIYHQVSFFLRDDSCRCKLTNKLVVNDFNVSEVRIILPVNIATLYLQNVNKSLINLNQLTSGNISLTDVIDSTAIMVQNTSTSVQAEVNVMQTNGNRSYVSCSSFPSFSSSAFNVQNQTVFVNNSCLANVTSMQGGTLVATLLMALCTNPMLTVSTSTDSVTLSATVVNAVIKSDAALYNYFDLNGFFIINPNATITVNGNGNQTDIITLKNISRANVNVSGAMFAMVKVTTANQGITVNYINVQNVSTECSVSDRTTIVHQSVTSSNLTVSSVGSTSVTYVYSKNSTVFCNNSTVNNSLSVVVDSSECPVILCPVLSYFKLSTYNVICTLPPTSAAVDQLVSNVPSYNPTGYLNFTQVAVQLDNVTQSQLQFVQGSNATVVNNGAASGNSSMNVSFTQVNSTTAVVSSISNFAVELFNSLTSLFTVRSVAKAAVKLTSSTTSNLTLNKVTQSTVQATGGSSVSLSNVGDPNVTSSSMDVTIGQVDVSTAAISSIGNVSLLVANGSSSTLSLQNVSTATMTLTNSKTNDLKLDGVQQSTVQVADGSNVSIANTGDSSPTSFMDATISQVAVSTATVSSVNNVSLKISNASSSTVTIQNAPAAKVTLTNSDYNNVKFSAVKTASARVAKASTVSITNANNTSPAASMDVAISQVNISNADISSVSNVSMQITDGISSTVSLQSVDTAAMTLTNSNYNNVTLSSVQQSSVQAARGEVIAITNYGNPNSTASYMNVSLSQFNRSSAVISSVNSADLLVDNVFNNFLAMQNVSKATLVASNSTSNNLTLTNVAQSNLQISDASTVDITNYGSPQAAMKATVSRVKLASVVASDLNNVTMQVSSADKSTISLTNVPSSALTLLNSDENVLKLDKVVQSTISATNSSTVSVDCLGSPDPASALDMVVSQAIQSAATITDMNNVTLQISHVSSTSLVSLRNVSSSTMKLTDVANGSVTLTNVQHSDIQAEKCSSVSVTNFGQPLAPHSSAALSISAVNQSTASLADLSSVKLQLSKVSNSSVSLSNVGSANITLNSVTQNQITLSNVASLTICLTMAKRCVTIVNVTSVSFVLNDNPVNSVNELRNLTDLLSSLPPTFNGPYTYNTINYSTTWVRAIEQCGVINSMLTSVMNDRESAMFNSWQPANTGMWLGLLTNMCSPSGVLQNLVRWVYKTNVDLPPDLIVTIFPPVRTLCLAYNFATQSIEEPKTDPWKHSCLRSLPFICKMPPTNDKCPDGWIVTTTSPKMCYLLESAQTWTDAMARCARLSVQWPASVRTQSRLLDFDAATGSVELIFLSSQFSAQKFNTSQIWISAINYNPVCENTNPRVSWIDRSPFISYGLDQIPSITQQSCPQFSYASATSNWIYSFNSMQSDDCIAQSAPFSICRTLNDTRMRIFITLNETSKMTFPQAVIACGTLNGTITSYSSINHLRSLTQNLTGNDSWLGLMTFSNCTPIYGTFPPPSPIVWPENDVRLRSDMTVSANTLCLAFNLSLNQFSEPPKNVPNMASCFQQLPFICKQLLDNPGDQCWTGWLSNTDSYGKACYYYPNNLNMTWTDAMSYCASWSYGRIKFSLNFTTPRLLYFFQNNTDEVSFLNATYPQISGGLVWTMALKNGSVCEGQVSRDYWVDGTPFRYLGMDAAQWETRETFCPLLVRKSGGSYDWSTAALSASGPADCFTALTDSVVCQDSIYYQAQTNDVKQQQKTTVLRYALPLSNVTQRRFQFTEFYRHTQRPHSITKMSSSNVEQSAPTSSVEYAPPPPPHRARLSATMPSKNEFSVWNIFKQFVGKDLTKITMPVILNEPISFEQRLCEYLEYSELLDRAAQSDDPLERFEWVLAFTIASNASSEGRLQKPFNPVLGETYEYARIPNNPRMPYQPNGDGDKNQNGGSVQNHNQQSSGTVQADSYSDDAKSRANGHERQSVANGDAGQSAQAKPHLTQGDVVANNADCLFRGFRYVSEQVSHHPPVSAFYAEQLVRAEDAKNGVQPGWTLTGAVEPKVKFWGKLFEIEPRGMCTLTLNRHQETYTWSNPGFYVHNVLLGFTRIWVEIQGEPELRCMQTGWHARVNYTKASGGFFDTRPRADRLHRVTAVIYDAQGERRSAVYGKWTQAIYAVPLNEFDRHFGSAYTAAADQDTKSSGELFNLRIDGQRRLWTVAPRPQDSASYYTFTDFCMQLNDPEWPCWFASVLPLYHRPDENVAQQPPAPAFESGLLRNRNPDASDVDPNSPTRRCWLLPPTDSRWRGDMRMMEMRGNLEIAGNEKSLIEEKQREARRRRGKKEHTPLWFRPRDPGTANSDIDWVFTHEYWRRDWSKTPDLF